MVADELEQDHENRSSDPNQTSGRKAFIVENRANCRLRINERKGSDAISGRATRKDPTQVEIPEPGFASRSRPTCPLPGRVGREPSCSKQTAKRRGPKDQGHKDSDGKIDQIEAAENSQNPDVPKSKFDGKI